MIALKSNQEGEEPMAFSCVICHVSISGKVARPGGRGFTR